MACSLGLMHLLLHLREQRVHPLHLPVSITGLKRENLETRPSTEPTGQTELHQVRPPFQARMNISTKVTAATMNVGRLFIHTSVG